jgi:hypothetical protein
MTKSNMVYRIVCAHYGTAGHTTHHYSKGTLEKALQSKIDNDHRSEMARTDWYAGEAPWRIETSEKVEWVDITEDTNV